MKTREKVLVTGADGMLGLSICKELTERGYLVRGVILPGRNSDIHSNHDIEIEEGNILDVNFLMDAMEGCAYVIHTAALMTIWPRRSEQVRITNVEGTKNVMEAAERMRIKRMVHIGSAASFNHGPIDSPGDESKKFEGWKYRMDYIESKYLAQQLLLRKFSESGFPVIIINPTYMIGPYDSGPSSGKMILEYLKGSLLGYSAGGKNFVCSIDVASAAVNALKLGRLGECYIIGSENLNYKEFLRKVSTIRIRKFRLMKVPSFLVLGIGIAGSIVARLTSTPPKLSYTMARFACTDQYYSSKKAEQELNIRPAPIEKGIDSCISWFESNGYIK